MSEFSMLISACETEKEAEQLAERLVKEHLAACVQVIAGVQSTYHWEGKLVKSCECLLLMKTVSTKVSAVTQRISELHSYDVPEIIEVPIQSGLPDYLNWVKQSLS